MAEITLNVIGSTIGEVNSTVALAQPDSDRLMAFLVSAHGLDEQGNQRTPQQMIDAYWSAMVTGTLANVFRWEQDTMSKAARDAVTPLLPVWP